MSGRFLALAAGLAMMGWAWWQRFQEQDGGPTGPIPEENEISGHLVWGDPEINGVGIRQAGNPANVTIDISGMRAGDPYKIQNRRLSDGVVVSEAEGIVPSTGRVLQEDIQTEVPWWVPGDYEVVLVYFDMVINLQPGFRIVEPITHDSNTINLDEPIFTNPEFYDEWLKSQGWRF